MYIFYGASLVAQMVKNMPEMQETRVRSLDWEDPLDKKMAAHSNILAWKISRTEETGGYSPQGRKSQSTDHRVRQDLATKHNLCFCFISSSPPHFYSYLSF